MARAQILIVEDEIILATAIRDTLLRLGYEITGIACSGEEAIRKVTETVPELVLMDIVLKGDMDGVKTAEYINARFDIPVIYLTAYADENILQRAKIIEPYGYILKPSEERELHTNIEIALYRHRMEKKLKEDHEILKAALEKTKVEGAKSEAIIEAIGDGMSIHDTDYRILYQNKVARDMFGDHVGEYCYMVYEQRDRVCEECPVAMSFADGKIHTVERSNPTRTLHVEITTSPVRDSTGKIIAGIELVRDITKRKQAEEAMLESEQRYRNLFENAHDMIQSVAPDGHFIFVNPAWLKTMGYTSDDLKTLTLFDIIHPDYKTHCMDIFKKVMYREAVDNIEVTFIAKDGRKIYVEGNVNVRLAGEKVVATQGIFRDITARKKMEVEVLHSKQLWEDTFNTITDMITVHDADFNIILANKEAQKILGLPFLNVNKVKCYEYYHGTNCPPQGCPSCLCLKTGLPASSEMFEPHLNMFIEIEALPRFDSNHQVIGLIHVVRDITERKKTEGEKAILEEQLLHSQKMEALGTLTGGIAHEFNNIMTAIIGYGEILQEEIKRETMLRKYVDMIMTSAERAAKLTQGLLAYSRRQIVHLEPADINEIIKEVKRLLSGIIDVDITLRMLLTEEKLTVTVDKAQIEQVFMNLATNAIDAMPYGGTITITTKIVLLNEEFAGMESYMNHGKYALISVSDTGIGMDRETKEKIFEPFFTTKDVGKGTGLGLSMVYGIVKRHNGYITVYSELGKGSTFKIYLPIIEVSVVKAQSPTETPPYGEKETVLVAEDDKEVRELTKTVLYRYGYEVIEAIDGEDAIEKFMRHKDDIKLLLFDVIMPKKTGKDAYEEIRRIRPDIKIIFLSGYTANDITQKSGTLKGNYTFISKPIAPKELLKNIREVLRNVN